MIFENKLPQYFLNGEALKFWSLIQNPVMLGGISICLRKLDLSACMMIHILLVQKLQLQSQSVLIYLANLTLTAKSALHISHFTRQTAAALYYTTVGLEKI